MATPLTADQIVSALRAEGVKVVEHRDWRHHDRNHKGAWGGVNGVMLHHTVSTGALSSVNLCYDGYEGLPGPLCHGVITKDGTVYLVSAGRSNHAGGGDPVVLQHVINEDYDGSRTLRPTKGNSDGVDGNAHFYGFECVNMGDGKDPWPDEQVDAMVRASAALLRAHRWGERSTIGHKEWSDDKSDPKGPGTVVEMPTLRGKIKERLAHPANWTPIPPKPLPTPVEPPTPGATVTKPDRQSLQRSEDTPLIPGTPVEIYWTTEFMDDGQGHGAGGKTVAANVCYSAVVRIQLTGLAAGEVVEIVPIEMDVNGNETSAGFPVHVNGRTGGGIVHAAVPFLDAVAGRLGFKVINRGAQVVTMTAVALTAHYWPNA